MASFGAKLKHAWNAFVDQEPQTRTRTWDLGASYGGRPDRVRLTLSNERSIISSIYTRLSIDVAAVDIRHVRLDGEGRYLEEISSGLNNCLKIEANIDQAGRALRQDIAATIFDRGVAAVVPVDTSLSPVETGGFDILSLRVGEIVQWMPKHIRVSLYNEATGRREEVTVEKRFVAIIENPLYAVMNEPNSTLQRLIRKLNLLDAVDEQSSSGKLDMIIQLPYVIKSEARRQQADQRRKDIEFQLKGSQYGIAYTDGTEKITQLNRPAENNLLKQVEYLMTMLYSQLGLTAEVMNGTADEKAMLNYINRTIEPVLGAIAGEMNRKFLTKTARTQNQAIRYFRDPFKLVPMSDLAEMADKFTRNEIVSSNEFRTFIGMKPSKDPKADQLINSNMPQPAAIAAPVDPSAPVDPAAAEPVAAQEPDATPEEVTSIVNETFDGVDQDIDSIFNGLEVPLDG
jgi:Tfp pilus assembly major pilin PilA